MIWESESRENLLEITSIGEKGVVGRNFKKYTPPERYRSVDVTFTLHDHNTEVRIKPTVMEVVECSLDLEDCRYNKLQVGLRDDTSVSSVTFYWTDGGFENMNQFFFRDDKPSGFNFGIASGPSWPSDRPSLIDQTLRPYFDILKQEKPELADSLEVCVRQLEKPGVEYASSGEASATIELEA